MGTPLAPTTDPVDAPASSHRRSPSSFSRLPPRRVLPIPLFLTCLSLVLYSLYSYLSSPTTPALEYASRRASGLIWAAKDRESSSSIRDRVSAHAASGACQREAVQKVLSAEEMGEKWERAARPLPVGAGTKERLDEWEFEAPGWGVEPADWVRKDMETCPSYRIKPNQNSQQLDNSHLVWSSMNTSAIMGLRGEMIGFLRKKEEEGAMAEGAWEASKVSSLFQIEPL
ncbi:hypothetical protein JCM6882_004927 [Rhodosporidiobolus microsporus]